MYLPRVITNPETGEQIAFDESDSDDERLVWEERRPANRDPLPAHYHPTADERFVVLEGHLAVQIDGVDTRLDVGDEIVVPAETPHRSYTGEEPARFRREVRPPERWREFLTVQFAYAHENGELSGAGGLLQTALWLQAYPNVIVFERPPEPVQRALLPALAGIARIAGRKTFHSYPLIDEPAKEERLP